MKKRLSLLLLSLGILSGSVYADETATTPATTEATADMGQPISEDLNSLTAIDFTELQQTLTGKYQKQGISAVTIASEGEKVVVKLQGQKLIIQKKVFNKIAKQCAKAVRKEMDSKDKVAVVYVKADGTTFYSGQF